MAADCEVEARLRIRLLVTATARSEAFPRTWKYSKPVSNFWHVGTVSMPTETFEIKKVCFGGRMVYVWPHSCNRLDCRLQGYRDSNPGRVFWEWFLHSGYPLSLHANTSSQVLLKYKIYVWMKYKFTLENNSQRNDKRQDVHPQGCQSHRLTHLNVGIPFFFGNSYDKGCSGGHTCRGALTLIAFFDVVVKYQLEAGRNEAGIRYKVLIQAWTRDYVLVLKASFRGYPLEGKVITLPSGYKGIVVQETLKRQVEGSERNVHLTHTFKSLTFWNWDRTPSRNDPFIAAFDWIDLANAGCEPLSLTLDVILYKPEMRLKTRHHSLECTSVVRHNTRTTNAGTAKPAVEKKNRIDRIQEGSPIKVFTTNSHTEPWPRNGPHPLEGINSAMEYATGMIATTNDKRRTNMKSEFDRDTRTPTQSITDCQTVSINKVIINTDSLTYRVWTGLMDGLMKIMITSNQRKISWFNVHLRDRASWQHERRGLLKGDELCYCNASVWMFDASVVKYLQQPKSNQPTRISPGVPASDVTSWQALLAFG
uniref:Uncharacterized protein n=1 Tax=Timema cristinae TaxID=61476 RepID=A0A7R9CYA9_TIMCR|nr:unnamed protein product [Timema cristinae]